MSSPTNGEQNQANLNPSVQSPGSDPTQSSIGAMTPQPQYADPSDQTHPSFLSPYPPSQPYPPYQPYPTGPAYPSMPLYPGGAGYPVTAAPPTGPAGWPTGPGTLAPPKPRRRRWLWVTVIVGLVVILIVGLLTAGLGLYLARGGVNPLAGAHAVEPKPTPTPVTPLVLSDPLATNTYGWTDETGHCVFSTDGYLVTDGSSCFAPVASLGAQTISVSAKAVGGGQDYSYGLQFWQQPTAKLNCYAFLIDNSGEWALFRTVEGNDTVIKRFTRNSAIKVGPNAVNTLEVRLGVGAIELFVNGVRVGTSNDTTFSQGLTGLYANVSGDAVFTDFTVHAPIGSAVGIPTGGAYHDPLTSDLGNLPDDSSAYDASGYHMNGEYVSPYGYNDHADRTLTVNAKATGGNLAQGFGLAFRYSDPGNAYLFVIDATGNVALIKLVNQQLASARRFDKPVVMRLGKGAINTLSVKVAGSQFEFFVNGASVGTATDTSFSKGLAGFIDLGAQVVFSDYYDQR